MLPKASRNYIQERNGINAVALVAAKLGVIWRETSTADVGIDGQLEFVNQDGFATGRTVVVQVKSGPSFFQHEDSYGWRFYPEQKHRMYWERYPLPVLLVLHNPIENRSYWIDARKVLRSPTLSILPYISIPKECVLETASSIQLFANAGVSDDQFIPDLNEVLIELVNHRSQNGAFPVSFFDLFALGLTNICRTLYFGMDIAVTAAEIHLAMQKCPFGIGVSETDHNFLFDYVKFLVAQHLAEVDFGDCLIDWDERKMQPFFIAPLTSRGRKLVCLIDEREISLVKMGHMEEDGGLCVAQEGFCEMAELSYVRRIPRILKFQHALCPTTE